MACVYKYNDQWLSEEEVLKVLSERKEFKSLYQNLLKELETGRGKDVLDRVKRDYQYKESIQSEKQLENLYEKNGKYYFFDEYAGLSGEDGEVEINKEKYLELTQKRKYTLEEQQEEAIVELMSLMVADKLDKVKDKNLISLLKQLLKEMKQFVRALLSQREVEIDKLPTSMTINDLSDLLAYSNSKLILDGYMVEYTTPDDEKFKTYQEASNHISELSKNVKDVDLDNVSIENKLTEYELEEIAKIEELINGIEKELISEKYQENKNYQLSLLNKELAHLEQMTIYSYEFFINFSIEGFENFKYLKLENTYNKNIDLYKYVLGENYEGYYLHGYNPYYEDEKEKILPITNEKAEKILDSRYISYYAEDLEREVSLIKDEIYDLETDEKMMIELRYLEEEINTIKSKQGTIRNFIIENTQYAKSKEIIEEWKKVNDIQYNPEEVYSRNRKFYHKVGAYISSFDPVLMMQNYMAYLEDYERIGAELVINGFTRTETNRVSFESKNIESSPDLRIVIYPTSEDIKWVTSKDAMSGTTRQNGRNVSEIFGIKNPGIAGIGETKAPALYNINLIKPSLAEAIESEERNSVVYKGTYNEIGLKLTGTNFRFEYDKGTPYQQKKMADKLNALLDSKFGKIKEPGIYNNPIQPTITKKTLKESIESIEDKILYPNQHSFIEDDIDLIDENGNPSYYDFEIVKIENDKYEVNVKRKLTEEEMEDKFYEEDWGNGYAIVTFGWFNTIYEARAYLNSNFNYTEQALINAKIVALKQAGRKYHRSLIRSEVKKIENNALPYEEYDMFQKLPSVSPFEEFQKSLDKPDTNPVLTGNLKPDIILPIGTSGSGKSTWIKSVNTDNQFVVISPDDMRVEFTGDMNNKSKDDEIYQAVTDRAIQAVKEGKQVIVDTTNLKKERRRPFVDAVKKALPNSIIQYKLLPLNPELAKQRIKADIEAGVNRANVPDSTIDKHAKSYNDMLEDIKSEDISNYDYKEEQAKKFNELQEKLQDETFLEAVKSVFDNSSKLQQFAYETFLPDEDTSMKLSSKEEALSLYIDYVAKIALGIIKNPSSGEYNDSSKVTDILHHGVTRGEIKDFDKFSDINQSSGTWGKGYYFAPTSNKFFVNAPIEKYVIVNSKKVITEKEHKTLFEEYKKRGFQGTVGLADTDNMFKEVREKYDTIDARERELIVFNPDQIHILDSKTDIEGFEKYIFNKSKQRPVVETKDTVDNLPLSDTQLEEIEDIVEADNSPISVTPKKEVIQLPKTAQLILPIGISGSGKSTWINSLDKDKYTIISPDEIRKELTGDVSDNSRNIEIFKIVDDRILEALKKGDKVILDATNLNTTFRRLMITNLKSLYPKLDIRYKLLDVDPEIAKQRIANDISNKVDRSKTPDEIIDLQYQQYLQSKLDIKDEPIYEFNNERTAITDLLDRYSKNDNSLRKLTNIAAISGKTQNISNVPIVKDTDNINENIITMAKYGRTVRELLAIYPSLTEHFKGINLDTKLSDYIKQQEIEKQVIDYVEAIKQDMADNFSDYEDYLSNINIYTIDDLYNYPNEKLLNDLCINGNLSK